MSLVTESSPSSIVGNQRMVTFYVGDLMLGLPIEQVQEINRHLDVTRVPHAPRATRGVINLRGEVVTVIDLPAVLGLETVDGDGGRRNVVTHAHGQLAGLLVDRLADIVLVPTAEITSPPANVRGVDGRFFHGVYATENEIVVVLNLEEVLQHAQQDVT